MKIAKCQLPIGIKRIIAKIGTVEEEADESAFWLELIIEGGLLKQKVVGPLLTEANELTRIMARSRISAQRNLKLTKIGSK